MAAARAAAASARAKKEAHEDGVARSNRPACIGARRKYAHHKGMSAVYGYLRQAYFSLLFYSLSLVSDWPLRTSVYTATFLRHMLRHVLCSIIKTRSVTYRKVRVLKNCKYGRTPRRSRSGSRGCRKWRSPKVTHQVRKRTTRFDSCSNLDRLFLREVWLESPLITTTQ